MATCRAMTKDRDRANVMMLDVPKSPSEVKRVDGTTSTQESCRMEKWSGTNWKMSTSPGIHHFLSKKHMKNPGIRLGYNLLQW